MTDDSYNPFKALDKTKFRNANEVEEKERKNSKASNVPELGTSSVYDTDDDIGAFARAMGGVAPMAGKGNVKGTPKGVPKAGKVEQPKSVAEESVNMSELDAFRKVKKLSKKKGLSTKIKPSREENESRDRSREAVATAKPKEEKSEDEAFMFAMQGVEGLSGKGREVVPQKKLLKGQEAEDPVKALQDLLDGQVEFTLEYSDEYMQAHVDGLDPLVIGKMRAGRYSPEGHLDLHGMIAQEAYDALVQFIRISYNKGKRTVLVIPGRGKNSPEGYSILRQKVEHWLTRDPFKRVVLAFCTAQPKDGGAGALYVLLRKFKKSRGKVQWDRTPSDSDLFL